MRQPYIGKTCPYCQFSIKQDSEVFICIVCNIPHHQECWKENDGCTTFGCKGYIGGEALRRPLANLRAVEKKIEKKLDQRQKEKIYSNPKKKASTGSIVFRAIGIVLAAYLLLVWVINIFT